LSFVAFYFVVSELWLLFLLATSAVLPNIIKSSMFHKNLANSGGGDRDFGTPGIVPATPSAMTPAAATPGLTSSVMSPAPATPSFSVSSSLSGMTPAFTPIDGNVNDAVENHGDEDPENVPREGPEEEDIIRQLTTNMFTPASSSNVYAKISSFVESSFPPAANGTPQTTDSSRQEQVDIVMNTPPEATDRVSEMIMLQQKYSATKPVIHNVVATASLGCELDLKQIAMTARNAEYNPRRFAAVIMRIREPKSTALVFKSGKLVVTGTKSQDEAKHAARKFGRVIMKVGYSSARFKDFRVENLVSTFSVPFPIHLERLYRSLPNTMHSQYEPEVFPGLICRVPGGTLLIFVSGRCVMIGMKTEEDIFKAYKYILPKLEEHRKK